MAPAARQRGRPAALAFRRRDLLRRSRQRRDVWYAEIVARDRPQQVEAGDSVEGRMMSLQDDAVLIGSHGQQHTQRRRGV